MEKKYLTIGSWTDKMTGKPVTRLAEISSGVNKNGQPYELADTDSRETVEGAYPVGTILSATMNLTVQEAQADPRSLKLGTTSK